MSSLSTRNQLRGTVSNVVLGTVMAEVTVKVGQNEIVGVITRHSAERLAMQAGDQVGVLIKATEVMIGKGTSGYDHLSTRNQIHGTVTGVEIGSVMAEVVVDVAGDEVVAAITKGSAERLALTAGDAVVVLVKATEVMFGK
jgi:molybdate transport system regulatory protein